MNIQPILNLRKTVGKSISAFAFTIFCTGVSAQSPADPYLWLEDLKNPTATQWVDAQSLRALDSIKKMPGFDERYKANLRVLTQREFNIQFPTTVGDFMYNHFRTANQPSGVWRRAVLDEYRKPRPDWQTLLNIDAYNKNEPVNWTWGGAEVQPVSLQKTDQKNVRAMVRLSRGGSDAVVLREFDLGSRSFVPASSGGFDVPEAKGWAQWWSADELLIATNFGDGSLTASGYPREVRLWKRGTPLANAALLFKAEASDVGVNWSVDFATNGSKHLLIKRQISFFQHAHYAWNAQGLKALELPADSTVRVHEGHLLVQLRSNWQHKGQTHAAGALLIAKYSDFIAGSATPRAIFEPAERKTMQGYSVTAQHIVVNELRDLQSKVVVHDINGSAPSREVPSLRDWGLVRVWPHSPQTNMLWLSHQGFLEPQSLYLFDAASLALEKIHTQGPVTDASAYRMERGTARSPDGTLVPYTLIQRKDAPRDGQQTTLLYGYGGFGISLLPEYQRLPLLNWLDFGGTYVLAHIRGGGEFGTEWTEAAKGLKRQNGFDDFAAVAQALVDAKVTQASKLGIYGASNGGLLVSTVSTQRPELFGAVVSRVPLTDMQRYTQLLAGPSWIEEYGNPDKPEDWSVIARYSPYHNLKANGQMPPTLYITNRNDDRVHPAHGRKMVAKQLAMGYPTWLYEPAEGGHSGVATPQLQAEREALLYTFLMHHLKGSYAK
jgi:prolyl oligopeptidase